MAARAASEPLCRRRRRTPPRPPSWLRGGEPTTRAAMLAVPQVREVFKHVLKDAKAPLYRASSGV